MRLVMYALIGISIGQWADRHGVSDLVLLTAASVGVYFLETWQRKSARRHKRRRELPLFPDGSGKWPLTSLRVRDSNPRAPRSKRGHGRRRRTPDRG